MGTIKALLCLPRIFNELIHVCRIPLALTCPRDSVTIVSCAVGAAPAV